MFGYIKKDEFEQFKAEVNLWMRIEAEKFERLEKEQRLTGWLLNDSLPLDLRGMPIDKLLLHAASKYDGSYLYDRGWAKGKNDWYRRIDAYDGPMNQLLTDYLAGRCPECGK